jgi:hypothetical protein
MTTKNTARKTFANTVAPTLTAPAADLVSVTINGKTVSGSRDMILAILAGSEVPAVKPAAKAAPANKPAVVKAAVEAPIDFVAKAKEQECYKAARASAKAAGLTYNAKTNPTGGKFGPNRDVYWMVFWAGFNAKAKEIGIPVRARKTAE